MPTPHKTPARQSRGRAAPPTAAARGRSEPAPSPLALANPWLNAGLAPVEGLLQLLAQWRQTQAEWLRDVDAAWNDTPRPPDGATELETAAHLPVALVSENLGRAAHAASALWRGWLDTEAAWLEQAQSQSAGLTRQWFSDAAEAAARSGAPVPARRPAQAGRAQGLRR
jgi:hypothetical protein